MLAAVGFAALRNNLVDRSSDGFATATDEAPALSPSEQPSSWESSMPEPSLEAPSEWSTVFAIDPGPYSRITGVAEADGTLFALGRSDRLQPAIWFSRDGSEWSAADVPEIDERIQGAEDASGDLGALVLDVEDAGGRLVAMAAVGLADGSGYFGTKFYSSDDGGATWTDVDHAPGTTDATLYDVVRHGDRLIAVGNAVWASEDRGATWTQVSDAASIGGTLRTVDSRGGVLVAAGDGSQGELTEPPAIVLISADGITWERTVLDPGARARSVVIGATGRIIVGGQLHGVLHIWTSDDNGASWSSSTEEGRCCAADMAASDAGYVAGANGIFEGALTSLDGITWVGTPIQGGLVAVSWGPSFGFSGATDDRILRGGLSAP